MEVLESSVVRALVAKASGPGFNSPATTKIFFHIFLCFFPDPFGLESFNLGFLCWPFGYIDIMLPAILPFAGTFRIFFCDLAFPPSLLIVPVIFFVDILLVTNNLTLPNVKT